MDSKEKVFKLVENLSNGNSIYRSIIGLIIGIVSALGILMYFNILKWNSEFKVADLVGILAAILTLWAIYISSQAAKSAQISAEIARDATFHTEQQTILLKEQYERSISPKLIPSLIRINRNYLSITDFKDSILGDDLSVSIKNVGKGNAYYIHSWIELEEIERFLDSNLKINYSNGLIGGIEYSITFMNGSVYENPRIFVKQIRRYGDDQSRVSNKTFYIEHLTLPHPSLNENESMDFSIPDYVQVLFGDIIFNGPHIKNLPKEIEDLSYKFTLYIKYQTDLQLGTNTHSVSKFNLILNNIKSTSGSQERMSMTAGFMPKGIEIIEKKALLS